MEGFVTTQRFEDHLIDFKDTKNSIGDIRQELGSKVSWVVFWSIFSLLVVVLIGVASVLYSAVKDVQKSVVDVQKTTSDTQSGVSYLRGVLDSSQVTH